MKIEMNDNYIQRETRGRRGLWPLLGAASLSLLLAGCDTESLLNVQDPDIVLGQIARDTANLPSLTNGVSFEFARALTGPTGSNNYPGIIGIGGVLADEQWYASTFTQMREIDARNVQTDNAGVLTVFRYLQRARNLALQAQELYATSPRANTAGHAQVTSLAGYSTLLLAENFCSGVPLSQTTLSGALRYDPGNTTEQLLNRAIERFDAAITIAQAAGDAQQLNLARAGKARALQNLGRFAEAATVAKAIPANFVRLVDYSANASGQNNGIWSQINSNRRTSVATLEGTENQGLRYFNFGTSDFTIDPRVPVPSRSTGIGTTVPLFRQGKYPAMGSDVPLASYVEAQLIVAEDLLNKGQSAAYLPVLNQLRANLPTLLPMLGFTAPAGGFTALPALTDPGTPRARVSQLYQERAFWLWLTGHRLGDMRRLLKFYGNLGFTEDNVFPTGITRTGRPYGDDVNFPIPVEEGNNPEFGAEGACFDRNP